MQCLKAAVLAAVEQLVSEEKAERRQARSAGSFKENMKHDITHSGVVQCEPAVLQ